VSSITDAFKIPIRQAFEGNIKQKDLWVAKSRD